MEPELLKVDFRFGPDHFTKNKVNSKWEMYPQGLKPFQVVAVGDVYD
jgi:hypothetical protein